ncbi:glycoside hydrolase family 9 protein [Micromonosporaceae bacterium Da 78-11]
MRGSLAWIRRGLVLLVLSSLFVMPTGCARSAKADGVVRVDQVGYAAGETKTALLLAPRDAAGAHVLVVDAYGNKVSTLIVGRDRGAWNTRFRHVHPIDLTALDRAGTYRLKVEGRVQAMSPPFRVGPAAELFGPLAGNAVRYFQTHRDGADQAPGPGQRPAAHLADRQATVHDSPGFDDDGRMTRVMTPVGGPVDVEGGWYDAGDFLKFTHTTAYALILMLLVQRDGPAPAGLAAETAHGLTWLDKMWDGDTGTLYTQVGVGSGDGFLGDHDTWRLPEADDRLDVEPGDEQYYQRYRPVFRAAAPGRPLSPNLAGRVAAAFALAAQVEAADEPARARAHLAAAAQIYDQAETGEVGELVTSQPRTYYPERTWHDDLAAAATELSLAGALLHDSRAVDWAGQATRWAKANADDGGDAPLSVYDVSAVADAELARLLAAAPPPDAGIDAEGLRRDLAGRLDAGVAAAARDPMGAAAGAGGSDYAARQLGYAATAELYRTMTGDHRYAGFGTVQRGIALGANGWGTSLVIGAGTVYPRCPHDQIADLSAPEAPRTTGGVVNGPNLAARVRELSATDRSGGCVGDGFAAFDRGDSGYTDDVAVSATTEPAIDFTATGLYAFTLTARQR